MLLVEGRNAGLSVEDVAERLIRRGRQGRGKKEER
jgi:hypothetical protein